MNFTEIKKWCDEHPDAYVDIHISLCKIIGERTIKLKMQINHSHPIYRKSTDIENDLDLIPAILDEMYENIEPMLNSWAEYVALHSYVTINEARELYHKVDNVSKECAVECLSNGLSYKLLYGSNMHKKPKCTAICADPDLIVDPHRRKAQLNRINNCTKKDDFVCRWNR